MPSSSNPTETFIRARRHPPADPLIHESPDFSSRVQFIPCFFYLLLSLSFANLAHVSIRHDPVSSFLDTWIYLINDFLTIRVHFYLYITSSCSTFSDLILRGKDELDFVRLNGCLNITWIRGILGFLNLGLR